MCTLLKTEGCKRQGAPHMEDQSQPAGGILLRLPEQPQGAHHIGGAKAHHQTSKCSPGGRAGMDRMRTCRFPERILRGGVGAPLD